MTKLTPGRMKPDEWIIVEPLEGHHAGIVRKPFPKEEFEHLCGDEHWVIDRWAYDALRAEAMKLRGALEVYHQTRLTSFTDVSSLAIKEFDKFIIKNKGAEE